jgi:hypothetical protein
VRGSTTDALLDLLDLLVDRVEQHEEALGDLVHDEVGDHPRRDVALHVAAWLRSARGRTAVRPEASSGPS